MSRAFVKEDDQRNAGDELPERTQSPHPNYVTARGLADLKREVEALCAERETTLQGGVVGIIMDGRGRPLVISEDEETRVRDLQRWIDELEIYPEGPVTHSYALAEDMVAG